MINTAFVILTWLLGLAATLGPAAVILGLVVAPAVAVPLISKLGGAFLSCSRCIVAAIAVVMCVGSYWVGHWDAEQDCRAGELAAQLRNVRIDAENARQSAADELQRATQIEAQSNDQRSKDADYIKALESRTSCNLNDNDIGRLPDYQSRARRAKPAAGAR